MRRETTVSETHELGRAGARAQTAGHALGRGGTDSTEGAG